MHGPTKQQKLEVCHHIINKPYKIYNDQSSFYAFSNIVPRGIKSQI